MEVRGEGVAAVPSIARVTQSQSPAAGVQVGADAGGLRVSAPEEAGLHRIVVVGGGAGGLELATMLGDTLGKRRKAHITLIEKQRTHFWKPHLHEIAAGSMDIGVYETNYLAQAHWHHFRYRIGEMIGLDPERREGTGAPFHAPD